MGKGITVWVRGGYGKVGQGRAVLGLEPSLAGRHQVVRQLSREVVAVQLDVNEVHGQGKLVSVQHAVPVDVGHLPHFTQH